jgi:hypothetical protein
MGAGTSHRDTKTVKLARCSICRKVPTPGCDWQQGRCPHRTPTSILATINNFLNFFRRNQ